MAICKDMCAIEALEPNSQNIMRQFMTVRYSVAAHESSADEARQEDLGPPVLAEKVLTGRAPRVVLAP